VRSSQPCTGTKVRCVLPLFAGVLSHFYKGSEKCKSLKGKGKEPAGPLVHFDWRHAQNAQDTPNTEQERQRRYFGTGPVPIFQVQKPLARP
jgi:hypothetical protein